MNLFDIVVDSPQLFMALSYESQQAILIDRGFAISSPLDTATITHSAIGNPILLNGVLVGRTRGIAERTVEYSNAYGDRVAILY